ncbi:MAG: hypothetical protein ABJN40_01425 [Sneathiella sp.]
MQAHRLKELDAARRLVDLAIKLHFSQTDPVGVHTLTVTAYKILRRLGQEARLPDIVPDYLHYLNADHRHLFWSSLATLDPITTPAALAPMNRTYNYSDEITDLLLFIASALYRLLDRNHTHEMRIYIIWYKAINRLRHQQDPIYNENTKEGFDYLKSLSRKKQLTLGFDALKNLSLPDRVKRTSSPLEELT